MKEVIFQLLGFLFTILVGLILIMFCLSAFLQYTNGTPFCSYTGEGIRLGIKFFF